jgi:hypothetical protein
MNITIENTISLLGGWFNGLGLECLDTTNLSRGEGFLPVRQLEFRSSSNPKFIEGYLIKGSFASYSILI